MELIKDSHGKTYIKTSSGTCYSETTDAKVIETLEYLLQRRDLRIRVWYGDVKTGKAWNEEYNISGYLGRSTGRIKIPLLIHSSRSYGGGALLDSAILKIRLTKSKRTLYQHPKFHQAKFTVDAANVYADNELYARCNSQTRAQRLAAFMNGERDSLDSK